MSVNLYNLGLGRIPQEIEGELITTGGTLSPTSLEEETPIESAFTPDELDLAREIKRRGGTQDDFINELPKYRDFRDQKQSEIQVGDEDVLKNDELEFSEKFSGTIGNVLGGAISNVPSIVGNTFGFLADVVTPEQFEGLGDVLREKGISDRTGLQEVLGVDPESFATKAGEFGSEIGALFIPGGQQNLLTKFPMAADKITDIARVINTLGEKSPKIYNTLKSALVGAGEVGKFEIVSEGEVTPEGLAIGAVANPLIGTTIRQIGKISKTLAEKLELAGLLNPSKLDKVAKQLDNSGVDGVSNVADFLLNKNIKGSKEKIVSDLLKDAKQSRKAVDDALSSITKESFDESSNKALQILNKQLEGKIGLESEFIKFTKLFDKLQKKGITVSEKNQIKRGLDSFINIFKDSGEVIAGTTKLGASNVRAGLQKQIENEAKDFGIKNIKELNKNTQVTRTLADAIARKDASDQASALISAFAPSGVGAFGGALLPGDNMMDRLGNIIGGAILGKVAGSTTVKTNLANFLNKLSGLEKVAFEEFIRTKGQKELSPKIMEKLQSKQIGRPVSKIKQEIGNFIDDLADKIPGVKNKFMPDNKSPFNLIDEGLGIVSPVKNVSLLDDGIAKNIATDYKSLILKQDDLIKRIDDIGDTGNTSGLKNQLKEIEKNIFNKVDEFSREFKINNEGTLNVLEEFIKNPKIADDILKGKSGGITIDDFDFSGVGANSINQFKREIREGLHNDLLENLFKMKSLQETKILTGSV